MVTSETLRTILQNLHCDEENEEIEQGVRILMVFV
jgi:hypothetical protein